MVDMIFLLKKFRTIFTEQHIKLLRELVARSVSEGLHADKKRAGIA